MRSKAFRVYGNGAPMQYGACGRVWLRLFSYFPVLDGFPPPGRARRRRFAPSYDPMRSPRRYTDSNDMAGECQRMTKYASLQDFMDRHRDLFVLTGAGCSTRSGIPDYRDAEGQWKRAQPVT